jgi:glyoxylase-like metal-dependent hydrolase (beta-lactamase superfamily II)
LPQGDVPEVVRTEWAQVEAPYAWEEIASLRSRWSVGAVTLSADAAAALRNIDDQSSSSALPFDVIELAPSVRMMAVKTPTLPPATHTNVFVIGSRSAVLVEPATSDPEELERIVEWVMALRTQGITVDAILTTHHHHDHAAGARALRERLGVPLAAHIETDARLPGVGTARFIAHDERFILDGPEPIHLRAIHTPGHAPGHLCFFDERSGVLLAGDMVAGIGTILVEPGDGNMSEYLESLRRMITLDASAMVPAHGGVLRPPRLVLERYVEHRLEREQRVFRALERVGLVTNAAALVPDAYADAPASVFPLAALSTEAHLIKLEHDGLVRRTAAGWEAVSYA